MQKSDKLEKAMPTIGGTIFGYLPEFLNPKKDNEWLPVPVHQDIKGIPYPLASSGILSTINLFGPEQARALAWGYAASAAAVGQIIVIRVTKYKIVFDIKAFKLLAEQL